MRSREGIPNHISLRNIREDMVSILALLRTRAGVEFSVRVTARLFVTGIIVDEIEMSDVRCSSDGVR